MPQDNQSFPYFNDYRIIRLLSTTGQIQYVARANAIKASTPK
jgi:hypothetical protein